MPGIEDLKNENLEIDLTKPAPVQEEQKLQTMPKGNKTIINLNGNDSVIKGRHTIIESNPSSKRVKADLSGLPTMTKEEEEYKKTHFINNPLSEILEGEDSIFEKYRKEKKIEVAENYAIAAQEKELEELENEAELTGNTSDVIEFKESGRINAGKKDILSDDDILSRLNEEDKEMSQKEEVIQNDDEVTLFDDEPVEINTIKSSNTEVEEDEIDSEEEIVDEEEDIIGNELAEDIVEDLVSIDKPVEEETIEKEDKKEEKSTVEKLELDPEISSKTNNIELDVLDSEEEEIIDESGNDEAVEKLRRLATEKLAVSNKNINIKGFTVLKKPTANTKQLNDVVSKVAKWVLYSQEASVLMREFTGSELEKLREFSIGSTSITNLSRRYRLVYDHIESPKPATYEAWLKSTPILDVDHYFFAIYIASFKGSNYIPRDCDAPGCKETWLTDDIDIMDMVEFESEEAKAKFKKIYQLEEPSATEKGLYTSEIVPVSAHVAVGFKEPTIYSSFEIFGLDDDFKNKHNDIIDYIPYIDALYLIDQENKSLTPVGYKVYPDNATRSSKSKIHQFAKVLSTLTIDEFAVIKSYANAFSRRSLGIKYILPEATCPKCGKTLAKSDSSGEALLFTRYQLGQLVNMSLN